MSMLWGIYQLIGYFICEALLMILVCGNHMNIQDEVNQVVIHELIHDFDDCRAANLNWANCAHHACSEIRAGHLSGDCHYKWELLRGFVKIRGHEQDCVRRRVMNLVCVNSFKCCVGCAQPLESYSYASRRAHAAASCEFKANGYG
ncbi:PREDICTED: mitochondrial inner membrane protease ATP23 homolog [Prunus mume]|uniref:Mitochondrial inner membrane protease ATP23 n=1 Tax=Prunus mume TaxID=102107 RepID=A0ABM0PCV6_PRUMU|nr:PREDICTED: mitochondrial inner membrane protease ATP23 homolog [Prunus mume]